MTRQCPSCGGGCRKSGCERDNVKPEPITIIQQLWGIIDDIDTYSDMAKADDKLYRSLVERRQKDRWKTGITTDGQTLNIPFYTVQPRQWQGLTDDEAFALGKQYYHSPVSLMYAVEAKLKEKNHG